MIVLYNLKFVVMCSGASMKVLDLVLALAMVSDRA